MFECESGGCVVETCDTNYAVGEGQQSLTESNKIRLENRLQSVKTSAEWLRSRTKYRPIIAVVCGSGFGSFADCVENADTFDYCNIPHFVTCTVKGHLGRLVFGSLGGVDVVVMQGRIHAYEDHSMWQVTFPMRVFASLGVEVLMLTNACGSMNPLYNVGDLVIVRDHINLPGLVGLNPLKGLCDDRFGPRFPYLTDAYDRGLRLCGWRVGRRMGLESLMHDGISLIQCGPCLETPAELRMMRAFGADVVGMSAAPEVIVARQCRMRCFSLALVTNVCVMDDDVTSKEETCLDLAFSDAVGGATPLIQEEVLSVGLQQAKNLQLLLVGMVTEIGAMLTSKTE